MKINLFNRMTNSKPGKLTGILLILFIYFLFVGFHAVRPRLVWQYFLPGTAASFRSLALAGPGVVWAGGTGNTWLRTVNGGKSWSSGQVPAAISTIDFRGVAATGRDTAWLMSAGESAKGLALIYKTTSGGKNWNLQYADNTPGLFLDGIKFWDSQHGIVFGDPASGHFLILRTDDGGETWKRLPAVDAPRQTRAEGAFAASNTSLCLSSGGQAWIGTGGSGGGHVFHSADFGRHWEKASTSLRADTSAGIFGLCFINPKLGVAVGGDYLKIHDRAVNAALTTDGGRSWQNASGFPDGLEEAAVYLPAARLLVAAGPSGTSSSADSGRHWLRIDTATFHSLAVSGNECWAIGARGKIARLSVR